MQAGLPSAGTFVRLSHLNDPNCNSGVSSWRILFGHRPAAHAAASGLRSLRIVASSGACVDRVVLTTNGKSPETPRR